MKSRLNWKPEEDKMIRYLRNEEKIASWNTLAERLNFHFPENERSGKQCRERYSNTARFPEQVEQDKTWTRTEDELLCSLYLENGSKWTLFMKEFPFKSQNTIKNRFYCCLRKATRKLKDFQGKSPSVGKNVIKSQMLITILQLANRVEKESMAVANVEVNLEWNILRLRRNLLDLSFQRKDIPDDQLREIVKLIHKMNYRFKCLGITKMKSKFRWEMTKKRLFYILGFETDLSLSRSMTEIQTTPSQDRNSASISTDDNILEQDSLEQARQDPNLEIFQQQSRVINQVHCQILERQFCQILGIQYQPTFTTLPDFYLN